MIASLVASAVAPYAPVLDPEALEAMRSAMAVQLASHPVLSGLVGRLRERAAPLRTGAEGEPPEASRGKKAGGAA